MEKLKISLLGRFQVQMDGDPIEIRSHAAQSLFSYLILNPEFDHRRDRLAGMFWPDSDERSARSNLRHALWRIRRGIGEDIFVADKTTVALSSELDYVVDVASLDPTRELGRDLDFLLQAAKQYQGDLLPGFYDDWVILERERLRGAYARLMERLLEALIAAKRWGELSEWAERWIAMGHVPEPAFRALMVAHAARGDQAGVAAVYGRCVETLERELGVDPSPQTRLLHEQLMEEGLTGVLEATPTKERYELGEEIGRGGMGEVYRAVDTWLDREVAVKVLSSEALGEKGRERLLAEAQAAARLNHPNVVSVYDVGEMNGEPFIVMELVEGETLHEHRPESQGERLAIVLEICAALEHAHAQGIVHRDLKPENVMLAPDGMARLMDFGLASRTVEAPQAPEGSTAGTVYYLAPEVLQGEPASPQSDLYALGVLLYELLTGELPFTGEDPMAVITQHLEAEPKPPSELNREIRPALEALILRLLSKRPADRPLSAAAVAEVLEAVAPEEIQLSEPAPGEPPFKGLEYYDVEDAEIFFGREALVERLIDRLRDERFLAVIVGASGSGKSSVARAGLVPALSDGRDGDWSFRLLTPTERPLNALAEALIPSDEGEAETAPTPEDLAKDPSALHDAAQWLVDTEGAKRLLLIVDQLEELFTLCREEEERVAFIDNLLIAADPETSGPTVVVITLRADFYPHCAAYPALREALARNQEYIGPMSTSELRRAIEEPALRGGWKFQSGLVDLMLRDVRGEPGALPLLSHALLETWKRRSRRTLTLYGYAEAGGVRRAIARTAEHVYHQQLSENQRSIARNIFLRLTELGEGTEDTRRRVTHTELVPDPGLNGSTESVLATLAEARLITLSEEHVEVAHEALIREWPRLREWLDEDREGLRIHRHLTEAAQAWEALERDPGELYRGGRLVQALEWTEEQQPDLNPLEHEFLEASQALAEQREAEREAQLEQERESAKRLRRRAAYLAGALLASIALAIAAVSFGRQASDSSVQADLSLSTAQAANTEVVSEANFRATAEADALEGRAEAEVQAHLARSRELAAAVSALDDNPELSILLALQSIEETPPDIGASPSGVMVLRESLQAHQLIKRIPIGSDRGWARITADGSKIYIWSASERTVSAIEVETETVLWRYEESTEVETFGSFALSPDEALVTIALQADSSTDLSTEGGDRPGRIVVLRTSDGQVETVLHPGTCYVPIVMPNAFSPDGRWFMVYTGDEQCLSALNPGGDWIAVYDTATWEEAYRLAVDEGYYEHAAFTDSSDQILLSTYSGPAELWSFPELKLIKNFGEARFAAVSPDGQRIVLTTPQDAEINESRPRVVDGSTGKQLFFLDAVDDMLSGDGIMFSPDGSKIAVMTDGHDYVFDSENGALLAELGEPGATWSASFTSDAKLLLTVTGGYALLWDLGEDAAEAGTPIEFADEEAVWFNPNPVLKGPNLAVWAFVDDKTSGLDPALAVLDDTGRVVHELLGKGAQLPDGRFVAIPILRQETDWLIGPLGIWDPQTDVVTELTNCSALWSALDTVNAVECPGEEPMFADPGSTQPVVVSADGTAFAVEAYAAAGSERPIWVWDVESLEVRSRLGVSYFEELLAVGATWVATREWDADSYIIRDTESGEVIAELEPVAMSRSVELSPDGSLLYAPDLEGGVWVFDTLTWELVAAWESHDGRLRGFAISPDGQRLVTTGNDDLVKVWDISGIRDRSDVYEPLPLLDKIPAPTPSDAAWLGDDRLALFLAEGAKWLEVSLSVEDLVADARARLTRSFTVGECSTYQIDPCPTLEEIKGG